MANLDSFFALDFHAPNKPPYIDETNYSYWTQCMQTYIQATDPQMQEVIENRHDVLARAPAAQPAQVQYQEGEDQPDVVATATVAAAVATT
ncbi:hypothetical protein NL676_008904 [Syzygium grande]|nr:hypothetical protein NL676_008904 [Syzygium grande]